MSSHAKADTLAYLAYSWHILFGLMLALLACFFVAYGIKVRGIKRYFGYLWGEVDILLADIRKTVRLEMVAPRAGGLATAVQGLGFGALVLTVLTGAAWFFAWRMHWPDAYALKDAHEFCAWLLSIYFLGHGGMALLHFIRWQSNVSEKSQADKKK